MGWIGLLMSVYLVFYAGSFDLNPRYSIQIVVPLILLAVSSLRFLSRVQRYPVVVALAGSLLFSNLSERPEDRDPASFVNVLASDHRRMVLIADDLGPDSIVLTTEPEVFLNHGIPAMNAVFATERPQAVQAQSDKYGMVLYYSGHARHCPKRRTVAHGPPAEGGVQTHPDRVLHNRRTSDGSLPNLLNLGYRERCLVASLENQRRRRQRRSGRFQYHVGGNSVPEASLVKEKNSHANLAV